MNTGTVDLQQDVGYIKCRKLAMPLRKLGQRVCSHNIITRGFRKEMTVTTAANDTLANQLHPSISRLMTQHVAT